MSKIEFLTTHEFEKEFKRLKKKYHSLADDLRVFKSDFIANPNIGTDLGGNVRKIRISIKSKGKGKSGGARLIIYDLVINLVKHGVILVTIYDKSDTESITNNHIKDILARNGFK